MRHYYHLEKYRYTRDRRIHCHAIAKNKISRDSWKKYLWIIKCYQKLQRAQNIFGDAGCFDVLAMYLWCWRRWYPLTVCGSKVQGVQRKCPYITAAIATSTDVKSDVINLKRLSEIQTFLDISVCDSLSVFFKCTPAEETTNSTPLTDDKNTFSDFGLWFLTQ